MKAIVAYAIDVGSTRPSKAAPRGAFAWARACAGAGGPDVLAGTTVASMLDAMRADASSDAIVALGIEAPLWIPIPSDEGALSTGRNGEGSRSCFAPAGGYVATLGLHQLAHVLGRLPAAWRITLDWEGWLRGERRDVLLWEAFVSAKAHSRSKAGDAHARDAATAAVEFLARADALTTDVAPDERGTLSLAGAALLWSSRATDVALLRAATLVVRPAAPFTGPMSEHTCT